MLAACTAGFAGADLANLVNEVTTAPVQRRVAAVALTLADGAS